MVEAAAAARAPAAAAVPAVTAPEPPLHVTSDAHHNAVAARRGDMQVSDACETRLMGLLRDAEVRV